MRRSIAYPTAATGRSASALARILTACLVVGAATACERTWQLSDPGAVGSGGRGAGGAPGAAGGGGPPGAAGRGGAPGSSGLGGYGGGPFPFGTGGRGFDCSGAKFKLHSPADVVFVVGRNASMSSKFDSTTRMSAVRDAIETVVSTYQKAVSFGYQGFPAFGMCPSQNVCCASTDFPIYPAQGNWSAISSVFAPCSPGAGPPDACVASSSSRPVSQALNSVPPLLKSPEGDMSNHYVILLTDGPPGCPNQDDMTVCSDAGGAVSGLKKLPATVYVVAVGDDAVADPCLKYVAQTAGTNSNYPGLLAATDKMTLAKSLKQIAEGAAPDSCTIDVYGPPEPIEVRVNGRPIRYDPSTKDGWAYTPGSNTRIQVHGDSCETVLGASPSDIDIRTGSGCQP